MSRGFVRALWGNLDRTKAKIWNEVLADANRHVKLSPVKVYTWGCENHDLLVSQGFDSTLLAEEAFGFDPSTAGGFWRHKLEALAHAARCFDEFIFVDWDIWPKQPILDDFWDPFQQKHSFQAPLHQYARRKVFWRSTDQRKLFSAEFVYIRDTWLPALFNEIWYRNQHFTEEMIFTYYVDCVLKHWPRTSNEKEVLQTVAGYHEPYCLYHRKTPLTLVPDVFKDKQSLFEGLPLK
jgi:hypothetical protein